VVVDKLGIGKRKHAGDIGYLLALLGFVNDV
jgi:hypothetical protein